MPRPRLAISLTPAQLALMVGELALRGLMTIAVPVGVFAAAALAF